ncbi:MAG: flavodoxin family protein [Elusimicrobiales bacterium]|nr:flavodoxin family protein [Elusimicrobiales bacterium]
MKILLLNGSHRTGGNTETLLSVMKTGFEKQGLETELISLATLSVEHCQVCDSCKGKSTCRITDDFGAILEKISVSDALIIGTPVYVGMPSSRLAALIQRLTYLALLNGHLLKDKIGCAVVVAGEAGHLTALNSLLDFFLVNEMTVPGSRYWPVGTASKKGEILNDTAAIENVKYLSGKIAKLLKTGGAR